MSGENPAGPLFVGEFWGPLFTGPTFPEGFVQGVGPEGSATFVLSLENGFTLKLEWVTDIFKSRSGLEQRSALLDAPKQSYSGTAKLIGNQARSTRAALARFAALGRPFLLGLPHEEMTILEESAGTVVHVGDTGECDWLQEPGQRVIVRNLEDESVEGIVQDSTADTIEIDATIGEDVGRPSGSIMPAMAVFLDPEQIFVVYGADTSIEGEDLVEEWEISARAALFGFAGVPTMGIGAELTLHGPAASVDEDDFHPVFDRGIDVGETGGESLHALTSLIDLDGIPSGVGDGNEADWGRQVSLIDSDRSQFQWLKAFLFTICGRQKCFWLPTWRPNLLPTGESAGGSATFAELDISALTSSGALSGLIVRALEAGAAGNQISITFVEGPYADEGEITEIGFPAEAIQAALLLEGIATSGVLDNVILRARTPGVAGNDIEVTFTADALSGVEIVEVGDAINVKFEGDITTLDELHDAIANASTLIEMIGTWNPSDILATADDEFGPVNLEDGAEEHLDGPSIQIGFNGTITTEADVEALLATSALVEVVTAIGSTDPLAANDDEFFDAHLEGGTNDVAARLIIQSGAAAGDFFAWWPARRSSIQIQSGDGAITYADIIGAVDNGDGTITLDLDAELPEDEITMVSWLERCRLESDLVTINIGDSIDMKETARVVQR